MRATCAGVSCLLLGWEDIPQLESKSHERVRPDIFPFGQGEIYDSDTVLNLVRSGEYSEDSGSRRGRRDRR